MRVAVFEDNDDKWNTIRNSLVEKNVREESIIRISHISQYLSVSNINFDLCIIDIKMPGVEGGETRDAGGEILSMLDYSGQRRVPVLAITAFAAEMDSQLSKFRARGCIVFDYDEVDTWSQALDIYIAQAREKGRYDFIIFTALKKERDGYLPLIKSDFTFVMRNRLDIIEFVVNGKLGAIVLFPRMGLVNATAIVARTLELYSPSVISMSGICAGIGTSSNLGQLLITDIVWEYQSGKWIKESFEMEPYQVNISTSTRGEISEILSNDKLINELEASYSGKCRPPVMSKPKFSVFATGSAVIASKKRIKSVQRQHRKVSGLDMEVFGFHRAAELSELKLHAFSAKVVVDKGDESKGDDLHQYGSMVSAAFVIKVLEKLLS